MFLGDDTLDFPRQEILRLHVVECIHHQGQIEDVVPEGQRKAGVGKDALRGREKLSQEEKIFEVSIQADHLGRGKGAGNNVGSVARASADFQYAPAFPQKGKERIKTPKALR